MRYNLARHLDVADPFGHGTSNAAQLGLLMPISHGRMFPWRAGGVALLRRAMYPDLAAWQYCGLAIGADTQLVSYAGFGHNADQAYLYAAVTFLGNGQISAMTPPLRLDFDSGGDLITLGLPMFPRNPVSVRIADGQFQITFEYDPVGQAVPPTDFQVFEGADPAAVDYNTPLVDAVTGLNKVVCVGDQRVYGFTTPAYTNDTTHVFGVRGRNVNGVAELNTYTTAAVKARDVDPADAGQPLRGHVLEFSRLGAGG